ncbi:hypothetical protein [Glycomyces paridis]|uniref:DUF2867 domain-containing protein n=1 Tax=Glycomyces paridis TaxID=2126555 RepID=A0A4V4HMV4_9ACTN|nr:hypothetical protein [Glycomyces paridis]THV23546.1 hypothetical protein E9998_22370 [Glycomyces paridis]
MSAPAFVDEHRRVVAAPRGRVWEALHEYGGVLARDRDGLLFRLLGTEPHAGFAVSAAVPGERLVLQGRHRFSRYRLVFALSDAPGGTEVAARTYADFPGPQGFVYRTLVVGSRGHAVAVRGMLRSIDRASR